MAGIGLTSLERYVTGQKEVLGNITKQLEDIKGRISKKGMHTVLLLLKAECQKVTPVGPGRKTQAAHKEEGILQHTGTGNLVNSYSIDVRENLSGVEGILANHASYALYVHEMPVTYNFNKPGTGPKFMEGPTRANADKIVDILHKTARIP